MTNVRLQILCTLVAILLPCGMAFGQFTLESHTPAHGSVDISTTVTLELTFSAPVDTDFFFEDSGSFVAADLYPYAGEPSISLSDTRTVQLEYALEPNTQYWFLLWSAVGTDGEPLDEPAVFTFSTGGSLPDGSISGTITGVGTNVGGAVVGFFPPDAVTSEDDAPALGGLAVVDPATGSYRVEYIAAGEYIPVTMKETDFDGDPTGFMDAFGGYDPDANRVLDAITIGDGESVTGIDMELRSGVATTAREALADAEAYAETTVPGAALAFVGGIGIDADGLSTIWSYGYTTPDSAVEIVSISGYLVASPAMADTSMGLIEGEWIDSDEATAAAEAAGGALIREYSEDALVFASLFGRFDEFDMLKSGRFVLGKRLTGFALETPQASYPALGKARMPGDRLAAALASSMENPVWMFQYITELDFALIVVDAVTAEVLFTAGLASSAEANLEAANTAALSWSADAELVLIGSDSFEGIRPDGRASGWIFVYYDATTEEAHLFSLSGGMVLYDEEYTEELPSSESLPSSWISSAEAIAAADAATNFRDEHVDAFVGGSLAYGQRPGYPAQLTWYFNYFAWDGSSLDVYVDAQTGLVITSSESPAETADAFELHPGYPNPFSSTAAIRFEQRATTQVNVAIYDLLGRQVAVLVDGLLPAGAHEIAWTPESLSGGVYVVRVTSGEAQRSTLLTYVP